MNVQITVSVAAGKRLIARAVAVLPQLEAAKEKGKILLVGGTTVSALSEELGYEPLWISGRIVPGGTRTANANRAKTNIPHTLLISRNRSENADAAIGEIMAGFGGDDLIVTGANVLLGSQGQDRSPYSFPGIAALALAERTGGPRAEGIRLAGERRTPIIIACGLEKYIPGTFEGVNAAANAQDTFAAMGAVIDFLPIRGQIITELEALRILFDVKPTVIAAGGILGGEGSRVFTLSGPRENLLRAMDYARTLVDATTSGESSSLITCEAPCVHCGRHEGCVYLKEVRK